MLSHNAFGRILFITMWTNVWTGERFGSFETYGGQRVNLPLSEVRILA